MLRAAGGNARRRDARRTRHVYPSRDRPFHQSGMVGRAAPARARGLPLEEVASRALEGDAAVLSTWVGGGISRTRIHGRTSDSSPSTGAPFRAATGNSRPSATHLLRAELEHVAARVLARKLQNATDRRVALSALRRAHARSREDTRRGQSEGPGRRRRVIASSPRQTLTDSSSASPIGIQQRVTGRSLRSKLVRRRVACAASAPAFSSGWTSLHAVESWSAKSRHHGAPVSCATARSSVAFVGLATHARSPGSPLS